MNIDDINKEINRLVQDNTYESCQKLAALYIVKDHLRPNVEDAVEKELFDILPTYSKYVAVRRNYQLGNAGEKIVEIALRDLCQEVFEFITALYSATNSKEERQHIYNLLKKLGEFIKF